MSPSVSSAVDRFVDFLARLLPQQRVAARALAGEVKVRIAPNPWGGLSLYPANAAALELFGGHEPTGNFATHADARRRLEWNCWTLEDDAPATLSPSLSLSLRGRS